MRSDDGKRPLGFVNRHGHQTNLESVDLAGVSIDAQPEAATEHAEQKPKPQKSPKIRRKRHLRWSRKRTLILIAILAIIVIIPIILGEILRGQYLVSASDAKNALHSIIEKDVLPLQKKADLTAKELSSVTDTLEKIRDDMCPGSAYDNLAMLYPRSKSAHQACIDQRGKIASLVTQLRDMENVLRYIEALRAALAPVSGTGKDAFAVIATQQTNWQTVSHTVQKLSPPTVLAAAHQQLVTHIKTIVEGWSKLNIANNNQDASAFKAAEKQLTKGYEAVRATESQFIESVHGKQATISTYAANL